MRKHVRVQDLTTRKLRTSDALDPSHVVGIGASAGGFEALEHLLAEPSTAEFPQMPEHARPFADFCLAPGALGEELMARLHYPGRLEVLA